MSRFSLRRPRSRGALTVFVSALLVVPSLVWMPVANAAVPCTTIGGFEIDGDMAPSTCAGDDWSNAAGVQQTAVIGTYNVVNDNSAPSTWTTGAGGTPPKVDFAQVYALTRVVGTDYYAYTAWERSKAGGSGGYALEIDNAGVNTAADGTPQPDRSNGGFVFYITVSGNNPPVLGQSCEFNSQLDYPGVCSAPVAGAYAAAINTTGFTDPLNSVSLDPGEFLEIGLDVSILTNQHPGCPATSTVASLYLRSFTGSSSGPTGNLKGYVAPLGVSPNSTCTAPDIKTMATPGNGTTAIDGLTVAAPGTPQTDVATVTGTVANPAPTGTVTFSLCDSSQLTAKGCESGGTLVGTTTLTAGAASSTATSPSASPTSPGTYCWRADYAPDVVNSANPFLPAAHTNSGSECFTVAHASPSIATTIGVVTVGGAKTGSLGLTTLGDSATLSGVVAGADLTGQNVTFDLYGPFTSPEPTSISCTAAKKVYTETDLLTNVDSTTWTATVQTPFTPTDAGNYTWVASYGGDLINDGISGACADPTETGAIVGATVAVQKTTPSGTITAGDTIAFDIALNNSGAGTATGVKVTDPLPPLAGGGTWVLDPNAYNCTLAGGTVTCLVGDLDPTAGYVTIAHVHAVTTTADCGTITNTATLTTTNGGGSGASTASVDVTCSALTITKIADAATVPVGSPIGFTVTVENTSGVTATNVHVTDPLPSGPGIDWSLAAAVAGCSVTGAVGSQSLDCTLATLAGSGTLSVHVVSTTAWTSGAGAVNSCLGGPAKDGVYPNTATVSATNVATSPTDSAQTTVDCPALTITKTADDRTVQAGHQIGYTLTARNNGDGDATGAVISDALPSAAGVSWTIGTATGALACSIAANTLTCSGTLSAHDSEVVHIVSPTAFASCGTLSNTATLAATNDPSTATSRTVDIDVICANVGILKTADATTVDVGSDIGYRITVTNKGSGIASGVDVTDTLPTGPGISWTIDSATSTAPLTCTLSGLALECKGTLAAAGDASHHDVSTVHVTSHTSWRGTGAAAVNSCLGGNGSGRYDNTASLVWSNGPGVPITSSASVQVNCPTITFTKLADAASVSAGSPIGFGITVANAGPGTAVGGVLTDPLPAGGGVDWKLDAVATTALGCSVTGAVGSQILSCNLGNLAAGASVFVHVVSSTSDLGCGPYANTAKLTSNAPTLSASDTTTVLCPVLTLVKTHDAASVSVGSPIGFTVTITNGGAGDAADVAIGDPLPSGPGVSWIVDATQLNGVAAPAGTCAITGVAPTQTLACGGAGFTLHANDVLAVHITSTTQWTAAGAAVTNSCLGGALGDGVYANTAAVTASNVVTTKAMTDTASEAVQCPSIGIAKTADAASVSAGDDIGYTVTASNTGTGSATGVSVNDALPGGGGVDWSVDSAMINGVAAPVGTCTVTGAAPTQTLTCGPGTVLASGDVLTVHVTSHTDPTSCTAGAAADGTFANTADLAAGNTPDTPTASATLQVKCAALTLTKVADAAGVGAGAPIGFTLTATNGGGGIARSVVLSDPLPAAPGLSWTIASADKSLTCSIAAGTLTCTGSLAPGASDAVHIVSPTTTGSCGSFVNTASVTWTGAPLLVTASAPVRVTCPVTPAAAALTFTKTALAASVSAGSQIGFDLTVADGSGTATGVTVTDPLPAGPVGSDVHYAIDPAYTGPGTCVITGPDGAQVLTCSLGTLTAGTIATVRVVSDTTRADCGTYANSATLTAGNAPSQTADASTIVLCAADVLTVAADQPQINSGGPIGFTLSGGNAAGQPQSGTAVTALVRRAAVPLLQSLLGTVRDAVLTSSLPAGQDVNWSIDRPSTRGTCAITGAVGSQLLTCLVGDLAPGDTFSVHIASATTDNSCGPYTDDGTLTSSNAASVSAGDVTTVLCVGGVQASQPPPVAPTPAPPLADTGAGPIRPELSLALFMIAAGALALLATRRRRRRAH